MKTICNPWFGILVLIMLTFPIIAGCQPASTQSAATETISPTATLVPTATIAPTPTEIVVVENEQVCTVLNFTEETGIKANDPKLGIVDKALVSKWKLSCSEPYIKGNAIAIFDGNYAKDGSYALTGLIERVTDEGGVWKGRCENSDTSSRCTETGEGIYKGLQMTTEFFFATSNIKIRIVQLP